MFQKILMIAAFCIPMVSCGSQDSGSSTTSIVDSEQRLFGMVKNPVSGTTEFRLCRGGQITASALNDVNVCINPYTTNDGKPLAFDSKTFDNFMSEERYLRLRGWSKGSVSAIATAVAAYLLNYGIAPARYLMFQTHFAVLGGFQFWGRQDREAAKSVRAVVGDFYSAEKVSDTKMVVNKLAKAAGIEVNPAVANF